MMLSAMAEIEEVNEYKGRPAMIYLLITGSAHEILAYYLSLYEVLVLKQRLFTDGSNDG